MGPKVKKILGDIAWNELSECMLAVKNTIHGVLKNMRDSLDKVNIVEMLVVVLLVLLLSDVNLTILLIDLLSVVLLQAMVVVVSGVKS